MPLLRVLESEVMSGAEEAAEYEEMDFSATDQLFAERAAELGARLADSRAAAPIVDIGSGNAKIPLAMCPLLHPDLRVCAVEMSSEMLAIAARNRQRDEVSPARLQLISGDAKRLPFADATIGMVTSNSLIHHIPDPRAVFREVARVLRPGGPILIRDLVRPADEHALQALLEKHAAQSSPLQRTLFADSLRAALTVDEVRRMLDEAGLADVQISQISDRHWSAQRA